MNKFLLVLVAILKSFLESQPVIKIYGYYYLQVLTLRYVIIHHPDLSYLTFFSLHKFIDQREIDKLRSKGM